MFLPPPMLTPYKNYRIVSFPFLLYPNLTRKGFPETEYHFYSNDLAYYYNYIPWISCSPQSTQYLLNARRFRACSSLLAAILIFRSSVIDISSLEYDQV